jgi:hypothetical protein
MQQKKEKNQAADREKPQVVQPEKQRPIYEVKILERGILSAAIWRNENDLGQPWFSISLNSAHKDAVNGSWKYTQNFLRDELHGLACVIQLVHEHIVNTLMKEKTNE